MSKSKPVVEVNEEAMWDYKYQAKLPNGTILASDSLNNLKKWIRENTNSSLVWLTCKDGCFSYGQNVVDEYPYQPRL